MSEIKLSESLTTEINLAKQFDDGFDVYEIKDEVEFEWLQNYCNQKIGNRSN